MTLLRRQHFRSGVLTTAALALHSASLFWVIVLLSRWAPATDLGYYVLGYAIGAPVFMFLGARQRIVLVNHVAGGDPTRTFIRARLLTSVIGVAMIAVISLTIWGGCCWRKAAVIILVAGIKGAEAVSDIAYGGLQRANQYGLAVRSITGRAVASTGLSTLLIPLTGSVLLTASALCTLWCLWALMDLRRLSSHRNKDTCSENRRSSLRTAFATTATNPLALVAALTSLAYYVPRYFIGATEGDAVLGRFGALSYFALMITMLGIAIADSLIPSLTQAHARQANPQAYLRQVRQLYLIPTVCGILGVALLLTVGNWLLTMLLGPTAAADPLVTAILLTAGTLIAITGCQAHVMVALGLERSQLLVTAASFALLLIASARLIPGAGMMGAALADLIYTLCLVLGTEILIMRHAQRKRVTA